MAQELRESEELFRSCLESAPDGVYMSDLEGNFLYGNCKCEEIIGYRREELIGKNFLELKLLSEDSLSKATRLLKANIEGKSTGPDEIVLISKEGSLIPVEINTKVVQQMEKRIVLSFVRDITERKRAEQMQRESEEKYRALVENASDIAFRTDNAGHFMFINPAALRVMGYEEKEIIGKHYLTFIRTDMREDAMKFFGSQFMKRIPNTYSEYPLIAKDGREIWFGQNTQLILQDGKVVALQSVARDITDRKQMEEALRESENRYRELSIIDDLTQLYNSRHFYFQLKIELDRSNRYDQPLTLLMLDLDDFKQFNDAYGHVEGNQVLHRLGQVVKRCLRKADFAFRYGGEEFTIILPMTTSADGIVTAERIRTEFKKELFSPVPGQEVHVTVSIGLSIYKPQEDINTFVHRVDQLMYQAKKTGKDRVCFQPSPFVMKREHQTKKQAKTTHELLEEISILKQRNRELEQSETDRQRAEESLRISLGQVRRVLETTARVLGLALAARDPYTEEHQKRTSDLARAIATEMGFSRDRIDGIRIASYVHDIGKISLPAEILSKPTKLNAAELFLVKQHAEQGYEILKDVESPWPLPQIVYQHHERMDGLGYPRGLKGNEIIMEARILAVADVVEAMASHRPYRPALGIDAALEEIVKNKGVLYDEAVADACLRLFQGKGYQFVR